MHFRCLVIVIIILNFVVGSTDPNGVFEYGSLTSLENEEIFVELEGTIRKYQGSWKIPLKVPLKSVVTYIRVEYINEVSRVQIDYQKNNHALEFRIKLPFVDTSYYLVGYAVPIYEINATKIDMTGNFTSSDQDTLKNILQWMQKKNLRKIDWDQARKMLRY
ncbi:hypothetical protein NE865_00009 [Phthorimaea operculella]|nr:hypothetical protein NE865_00009 [Phthorimaea operculella]